MQRNFLPIPIQDYVNTIYANLQAKVSTSEYSTDAFKFKRGIFQGNPLSPVIFLMCFNPIIDYLESINNKGFSTGDRNIINLPYADDFCVITSNKTTHQKILDDINGKVKSIGMKIKPSKCRSLNTYLVRKPKNRALQS